MSYHATTWGRDAVGGGGTSRSLRGAHFFELLRTPGLGLREGSQTNWKFYHSERHHMMVRWYHALDISLIQIGVKYATLSITCKNTNSNSPNVENKRGILKRYPSDTFASLTDPFVISRYEIFTLHQQGSVYGRFVAYAANSSNRSERG